MQHVTQRSSYPSRRQRGATLLEAIAFLGIAAIIVIGAVALLTRAFSTASSNRAVEEVAAIHTLVKKLYSNQNYGASATLDPYLIKANALPPTLRTSGGTTITNEWGGAVSVVSDSTGGYFTLTYKSVPKDACVDIATSLTPNRWRKVTIGGADASSIPIAVKDAIDTYCPNATNDFVLDSFN